MNWQQILKAIKAKGYTGADDDLAAIEAFIAEHFGQVKDKSTGKAVDIKALHTAAYPPKPDLELDPKDAEIEAQGERLAVLEATLDAIGGNKGKTTDEAGRPRVVVGKDRIEDDPKLGFKHFGDFGFAVHQAGVTSNKTLDARLAHCKAATGMQTGIGSDGGFLVPPEFSTFIWDGLRKESNNLLAGTDQYTVEGESLTFNANAETSRATGSRWGGTRAYWVSEAGQITSSRPKFRQVKLEPAELACLVYVTDKLVKKSTIALGQYLSRSAIDEINFTTGDAVINGTGAGQPLGILNSGCRVTVSKETGQAAATIVAANILKMFARHSNPARGEWFINQDIIPQLSQLSIAVGTGGQLVYMPPNGLSQAPFGTLLGRPVGMIEYCPTLGTEGDLIFLDRLAYASGVAGAIDSATSMHLRFDYAETAFRFMWAVDGQPWTASALTPFKGTSNTVSPFVTLETRS